MRRQRASAAHAEPARRTSHAAPRTTMIRKRFGQHFLEPAWVAKVIRAIDPQPDETFLEIGPGRGALTRPLLERAHAVVAFEIDRDLAAGLRDTDPGLTIVEGDFLEVASTSSTGARRRCALQATCPITSRPRSSSRSLDRYAAGAPLLDATLMLQREVADRLVAGPGGREYGVLSILVQHAADVSRLLALPPGRVQAAAQGPLRPRARPFSPTGAARGQSPRVFAALVQAIFTRRRKTLANALLAFPLSGQMPPNIALAEAALDGRRRPETLSVSELVRLSEVYGTPKRP